MPACVRAKRCKFARCGADFAGTSDSPPSPARRVRRRRNGVDDGKDSTPIGSCRTLRDPVCEPGQEEGTPVTVAPADDVVSLITQDHAAIAQRFSEFETATPETHGELFVKLRDQLVRHEYAEQAVVYPELRGLDGGSEVADARMAEESSAERALAELEKLDPTSLEFRTGLAALRASVLSHADNEEAEVLPLLTVHDHDRVLYLGQKFKSAKLGAPTRPHPHAPRSSRARKLLSPLSSFIDRLRDPVSQP